LWDGPFPVIVRVDPIAKPHDLTDPPLDPMLAEVLNSNVKLSSQKHNLSLPKGANDSYYGSTIYLDMDFEGLMSLMPITVLQPSEFILCSLNN
jgi:hypothetical protein